jgi:DNA-binding NarL/FixJ family response regulator
MRVLLVGEEPLSLVPLTGALQAHRPDWLVSSAGDGPEALRLLESQHFDALVADVRLPGLDGLALLGMIRADPLLVGLPLILVGVPEDQASLRKGMAAGADDYLAKPFSAEELVLAIESRLLRLGQVNPVSILTGFLQRQLREHLTGRELEVLSLIGQGLVTKEIAAALEVSPKTVSAHRQNIMEKLDQHNAAALATLASMAGLV